VEGAIMVTDMSEERAKQIAINYVVKNRGTAAWPGAYAVGIKKAGPHYVVNVMPENKLRMLALFYSYNCWVNATTGDVEKCT
jgi:hypothetical protein